MESLIVIISIIKPFLNPSKILLLGGEKSYKIVYKPKSLLIL
jgi:hypothetical protein